MAKSKWDNYFTVGDKYGDWTVIDTIPTPLHNKTILCKCACGVKKYVRCDLLILPITNNSCRICTEKQKYNVIPHKMFSKLKRDAFNRKILFDISYDELVKQYLSQLGRCALSGIELTLGSYLRSSEWNASVDRIDSSKGYVKDNIQFVSKDINIAKNKKTDSEFITLCEAVVNHSRKKRKVKT